METLDNPELNISDMIASHAALYGKSIAIIDEQKSVTWADFNRNINKIANLLIKNGIKKGERIAVAHNNSIEMLEICFGIVRAGGCLVPISTMLTYKQIFNLLKDSSCSGLFCSDSVVKDLKEISYIKKRNFPRGLYAKSFKNNNWEKLEMAMNAADHRRPAVRLFGNDFFNIIYTSGTTGLPKGILQTHKTKLHFSFSNSIELGIKKESKTLTTTSLFSNGTWIIMLPTLFTGGTLLIMKEFDPEKFIKIVQIERVTHTFVVPTQLISILTEVEKGGKKDFSSIEAILSAGSPLRMDTKKEVISKITSKLYELYGFSEGFATILKPEKQSEKFDTVGKPVLGFEVKIVDEQGKECNENEQGEIVGYGPGMLKEYFNNPKETEKLIWRDEIGRTFIRSGDIGILDKDGYLKIIDRKKDMIISGGINIYPSDIEEVIISHLDIRDVTVIGIPDPKWGETVLALVIPECDTIDLVVLKDWVNSRLAKYQRVGKFIIRDNFPRNALGKVLKKELREEYTR